jgi:hypothetical protein
MDEYKFINGLNDDDKKDLLKNIFWMDTMSEIYEPNNYVRDYFWIKHLDKKILSTIEKSIIILFNNIKELIDIYNKYNIDKFTYTECFSKNDNIYDNNNDLLSMMRYIHNFILSKTTTKKILLFLFENFDKITSNILNKKEIQHMKYLIEAQYTKLFDTIDKDYMDIQIATYYYLSCLLFKNIEEIGYNTERNCTGKQNPNASLFSKMFDVKEFEKQGRNNPFLYGSPGRVARIQKKNGIEYFGSGYSGTVVLFYTISSLFNYNDKYIFFAHLILSLILYIVPMHHSIEEILSVFKAFNIHSGKTYELEPNVELNTKTLLEYLLKKGNQLLI